jgi:hypothetical protein
MWVDAQTACIERRCFYNTYFRELELLVLVMDQLIQQQLVLVVKLLGGSADYAGSGSTITDKTGSTTATVFSQCSLA